MLRRTLAAAAAAITLIPAGTVAQDLSSAVAGDWPYLADLFTHFHRNPGLSLAEHRTAARLADELRAAGFEVTEGVGGTGLVALLSNGDGPLASGRRHRAGMTVDRPG